MAPDWCVARIPGCELLPDDLRLARKQSPVIDAIVSLITPVGWSLDDASWLFAQLLRVFISLWFIGGNCYLRSRSIKDNWQASVQLQVVTRVSIRASRFLRSNINQNRRQWRFRLRRSSLNNCCNENLRSRSIVLDHFHDPLFAFAFYIDLHFSLPGMENRLSAFSRLCSRWRNEQHLLANI